MKNKDIVKLDEISRRGFLAGMAGLAAKGLVPGSAASVLAKELATPAGAAARLSVPAAMALFQVIKDQLNQYDSEDDDDYYEAWENMAADLGFEWPDSDDYDDDEEPTNALSDLIELHGRDPKAAAVALVKHLQANNIDPNTIKVTPRDDWRYENRIKDGEQLIRNQKGDLEWVAPGEKSYPTPSTAGQAARSAATTAARTQVAPAAAASIAAFKNLVHRVMSSGQTQQPVTKDMGRIEPQSTAPALPAPYRSAVEIMAQLRDIVGRDLSGPETALVQQELQKELRQQKLDNKN